MKQPIRLFMLSFILLLISCVRTGYHAPFFQQVEDLMSVSPDSALIHLERVKDLERFSSEDKAHYYLLLTEARDKNYMEYTTDSMIAIATDYYECTDRVECKAKSWFYRGRINQYTHQPLKAQEYYLKALRDEELITDYALLGRLYNSIGILYTFQDVYEKALPFQKKAVEYSWAIGDSVGQVYTLRDLGRTFDMLKLRDSAIFCYQKAIPLMVGRELASVYTELADLYVDQQNYQEAQSLLWRALQSLESSSDRYLVYLTLGRSYERDKPDSAQFYLSTCADNAPLQLTRAAAVYYLSEILFSQGKWEQSAKLGKRYEFLRDSILEMRRTESIRKTQELYSYSQMENKLLKNQVYASNLRQRYILFISLSIFLLLFACYFLVSYRCARKKSRLKQLENEALIRKNERMIETLGRIQRETSDCFDTQVKELTELRERLERENRSLKVVKAQKEKIIRIESLKISQLYTQFHTAVAWKPTAEDWELLFRAVDDAYENFSFALNESIPGISLKERQLCYLLKIGVKPSIIAMLFSQSQTNISMMRKRLHEKVTGISGSSKDFDKYISEL